MNIAISPSLNSIAVIPRFAVKLEKKHHQSLKEEGADPDEYLLEISGTIDINYLEEGLEEQRTIERKFQNPIRKIENRPGIITTSLRHSGRVNRWITTKKALALILPFMVSRQTYCRV